MKLTQAAIAAQAIILAISTSVSAEEFTTLTNDQLFEMRGEARSFSDTDRSLFRDEVQSRVSAMSDEERTAFRDLNSSRANSGEGSRRYGGGGGQGKGSMTRTRSRQGGGSGERRGYGRGQH